MTDDTGQAPEATDKLRPAPVPGHYVPDGEPAPFDPDALIASLDRPSRTSGTIGGDRDEPTPPMVPPPGCAIPDDLAAALAEYDAAYDKWRDAVEARDDYAHDARVSRAKYAAALREAGAAVAAGRKRPTLPKFISEAAEAEELKIRDYAIISLRQAADRVARKADDLVIKHASEWVDDVAARCHPAAQEAQEAIVAAQRAYDKALTALSQTAWLRAATHVTMLKDDGAPVTNRTLAKLADEYFAASLPAAFKNTLRWGNDPRRSLELASDTVSTLTASMPDAIPHPDAINTSFRSDSGALWRVLRYWVERASEEAKTDYEARVHRPGASID